MSNIKIKNINNETVIYNDVNMLKVKDVNDSDVILNECVAADFLKYHFSCEYSTSTISSSGYYSNKIPSGTSWSNIYLDTSNPDYLKYQYIYLIPATLKYNSYLHFDPNDENTGKLKDNIIVMKPGDIIDGEKGDLCPALTFRYNEDTLRLELTLLSDFYAGSGDRYSGNQYTPFLIYINNTYYTPFIEADMWKYNQNLTGEPRAIPPTGEKAIRFNSLSYGNSLISGRRSAIRFYPDEAKTVTYRNPKVLLKQVQILGYYDLNPALYPSATSKGVSWIVLDKAEAPLICSGD